MKRTIALLLAVMMLLFAMAACNGSATPAGNSSTPTATPTPTPTPGGDDEGSDVEPPADLSGDLLVWLDNETWADAVVEAFNAIYPNVNVTHEQVAGTDQRAKLMLDGPAGIGADVVMWPHDHVSLAVQDGLVEPIPADLQAKYENLILKPAIETVSKDGEMYGLPIATENIALFYNIDLWGSEKAPETFEEIIEFAKTYNDPAAGKWALAWGVDDAYHNYHFLSAYGMSVFGPNNDDYKNPGFDSPEAKKGVEFHMSLRKYFDVPASETGWDYTIARFQNGEIPFTITGPWAIENARNNGINFATAKLPTIEGKQPVCFSGVTVAGVSSYTKVPELAYAFIDFLASPEGASLQYSVLGKMPAIEDFSLVEGVSEDKWLMGISEQSPYTLPMPIIPEVNQMWDGLKNLFQFTWDGTLTPDEAQAKAMDTYRTQLAAAGKSID